MSQHKSLYEYARVHTLGIVLSGVCVVLFVALNLLTPAIVGHAVDALGGGAAATGELLRQLCYFLAVSAAASTVSYYMRNLPLKIGHQVEYAIRRDLFAHLARLEQGFYRENRIGDLMTKMGSDVSTVRDFVGSGLLQGTRAAVVCVLAFAVMFATQPRLTLVLLPLFPAMALTFFLCIGAIRRRYEAVQEQYSEVTNFSQETFAGVRTVKGFALEERRRGAFGALNRELVRRNLRLAFIQQPLWPVFAFWFALGLMLLLLVGGRRIIRGEMTLGELVQFQGYLIFMQWPMLSIGWTASLIQRGRTSWGRLQEIFGRVPAIGDGPDAAPAAERPAAACAIEFRGVGLHAGGRALLEDIELRIPPGATVAITGPTGSGKTLLVSLLPRVLDPDAGGVFVDGRDVRAYPLHALRALIGVAPQEPVLFSDTLEGNLGFGLERPARETILWASEVAHLHEDVAGFPLQYETLLGERGVTLSGGQRQRTAIGRALARRPAILILDDVLAAVDTQTEAEILRKLRPVMERCTTLLVSHRVSTLRRADFIVVLENGRLTARGTHEELLARPGYYRELNELQEIERGLEAEP